MCVHSKSVLQLQLHTNLWPLGFPPELKYDNETTKASFQIFLTLCGKCSETFCKSHKNDINLFL